MTDTESASRPTDERIAENRRYLSDLSADARAYFIHHLRDALATCLAQDADVRTLRSSSPVGAKKITDAALWALWNGGLSSVMLAAVNEAQFEARYGLDDRSTVTEAAE